MLPPTCRHIGRHTEIGGVAGVDAWAAWESRGAEGRYSGKCLGSVGLRGNLWPLGGGGVDWRGKGGGRKWWRQIYSSTDCRHNRPRGPCAPNKINLNDSMGEHWTKTPRAMSDDQPASSLKWFGHGWGIRVWPLETDGSILQDTNIIQLSPLRL
jgi:hypothetical protein